MRKLGLMVAALALGAGCDNGTGLNNNRPDLSAGDGFVVLDLSMADLSAVPPDLSVPDLSSGDLALPLDAMLYTSFSDYASMITAAICDQELRCGRITAARYDACRLVALQSLLLNFDAESEISKSHLKVNAALCPPFHRAAKCDGTDTGHIFDVGPCGPRSTYIGEIAGGGSCIASQECATGFCDHPPDAGDDGCPGGSCVPYHAIDGGTVRTCTGGLTGSVECDPVSAYCPAPGNACVQRPALGETCKKGVPCQLGLYCPGLAYDQTVVATCALPPTTGATAGDACDIGVIATTSMPPCADNLYCQHNVNDMGLAAKMGHCEPKKALGSLCDSRELFNQTLGGNVCQDGSYCIQLVGESIGTCRALGGTGTVCNATVDDSRFPSTGCQDTFACPDEGGGVGHCLQLAVPGVACDSTQTCATGFGPWPCEVQPGQDAGVCLVLFRNWGDSCDPAVYNSNSFGVDECFGTGLCSPANNPAISRCVNNCPN